MSHSPSPSRMPLCLLVLLAAAPAAFGQYQPEYPPQAYPPESYPPPSYPPPSYSEGEAERPRVFDLSVFGGYQLNGDVGTTYGKIDIGDSPSFGAALDYRLHRMGSLELIWVYSKPDATFRSFNGLYPSSGAFGVASHYFQIGGMSSLPRGKLEPFIALTLGAALYLPDTITFTNGSTVSVSDTWRFATTLALGTKVWLTPNVGLRLETRLLVPMLFTGGGYYYGTGGSGFGASAGIPAVQLAFLGGLVFGK